LPCSSSMNVNGLRRMASSGDKEKNECGPRAPACVDCVAELIVRLSPRIIGSLAEVSQLENETCPFGEVGGSFYNPLNGHRSFSRCAHAIRGGDWA
jgi:hypothetical protein